MEYMNEQQFEQLWQRAEGAEHGRRLAEEYPSWRQAQRRNLGVAASLVAAAVITVPLLTLSHPAAISDSYTVAYCNRPDISNQYWVEMADALLTEA